MAQLKYVAVNSLYEHRKACALIPEMTEKEWNDFLINVEGNGIRQPLDVNQKYEVLDGRHRLRAAKELGIEQVEVRVHELTELEEMKFVRDTAIERRSLTPVQKLDIILNMEELLKELVEEGKKNQGVRNDLTFVSTDTNVKPTHDTINQIAEMSGTSRATVGRVKRLKSEAPELYEQVVKGEKAVMSAYEELPKRGRGNRYMTKEENIKAIQNECKQSQSLPQANVEEQMFSANVSTFVSHGEQLIGFIERIGNVDEIISEAKKRIDVERYIKDFERVIKILKDGGS